MAEKKHTLPKAKFKNVRMYMYVRNENLAGRQFYFWS